MFYLNAHVISATRGLSMKTLKTKDDVVKQCGIMGFVSLLNR